MSTKSFYNNFPVQTKTQSQRSEQWYKDCVDAAIKYINLDYHGIRQTYENKIKNYNLANDIFDLRDLKETLTPLYAKSTKFPTKMMHYPIAIQKIDLLAGEELKRKFNFTARVVNDDAITQKEEEKDKQLEQFFLEELKANSTPEEFEKALQEKSHYLNYEYQDVREKMANQILTYYWRELDLKELFNRGFNDLLIASEEIYRADIIGNEPVLLRCNPLSIHVIGGNTSPFVEDADIIIDDKYMTPADIVDYYYDVLTLSQIKTIEKGMTSSFDGRNGIRVAGADEPDQILIREIMDNHDATGLHNHGSYPSVNENGEIRVSRVVWKSRKKVNVLTYFDEQGEQQQEIVHEKYEVDESKGEIDLSPLWINEALEGTRIGDSQNGIYVKMQPLPVQNRKLDNISKCSLGYVGVYANINTNRALSLMDRLKPYQFLYNLYMNKLNMINAKYKGPMYDLDMTQIPDDYTTEEWMYYAETLSWKLRDPFNEGNKGAATGKLAGGMQQGPGVVDANMYSYIQQTIDMLNYIEMQAGSISGITKSREGQIHQSEAVSNVTREINQSAHMTEKWFSMHDQVKRKALELFLETVKYSFRNKNKKMQYILDDMTSKVLELDGDLLNEAQYGIQIVDTSDVQQLFNSLKELAHAGLQNDKVTFAQLMDVYTDNSITSIKRKLEKAEQDKYDRDQKQLDAQKEMQQMQMQQAAMEKEGQTELEMLKQANELDFKILELKMTLASKEKLSDDELKLEEELTKMKLRVEEMKIKAIGKKEKSL